MRATALEGRYRLLLYAYPPAYRRRHGDELLDVLLASAQQGARWPEPGQALGLLKGGLRTRRNIAGQEPSLRWWQVGDLAALALTGYALAIVGGQMRLSLSEFQHSGYVVAWFAQEMVTATILGLLLGALVGGFRRTAAGLAVAAGVVPALMNVHGLPDSVDGSEWWAPVIVAVLYGALLLSQGRPGGGSVGMRPRLVLGLTVLAGATAWAAAGPLQVRPLYLLLALLCFAYLGAVVDPGAVVVVASLLLPPSLAAISRALLQPEALESWATLTVLRLLVILTSIGFAVTAVRAQSRI